jgi:prolipoprotein diacylglyceryltransferase
LAYAAQHTQAYLEDPLGLLSPTAATLNVEAGALAALAAGLVLWRIWARRGRPMALVALLDVLAPGLAVMMVAFSGSHLASGSSYGAAAHLPWSIYLWDAWRHPSQVYELLTALGIWVYIERRAVDARHASASPPAGLLFLSWLALSAAARLILEAFRGDSLLWGGAIRAAQVAALAVLMIALWLIGKTRRTPESNATRASDPL